MVDKILDMLGNEKQLCIFIGKVKNTEVKKNKSNETYLQFTLEVSDDNMYTRLNCIIPAVIADSIERRKFLDSNGMEVLVMCKVRNYVDKWKTKDGEYVFTNKSSYYCLNYEIINDEIEEIDYRFNLNL